MATLKIKKDIDFVELRERIAEQFRGLDTSNPSSWPLLPRILLCVGVALVVFAGAWYFLINDQMDELAKRQKQETELKKDYVDKYARVVNLEPLRKQRQEVEQYVVQLEKQLPGRAEMDALLSDINQAGVGRSLQFELFKPAKEEIKDYYALLPVDIKVSGSFPDVAGFAADIAHLSRIVTLSNIEVTQAKEGGALGLHATANTYRYLDKSEMAVQQQNAKGKKGGAPAASASQPAGGKP